jgi:hypothetical protein
MTSTSIKSDQEPGEDEPTLEDALRAIVQALKGDNESLKRELDIWHRRARRAELEAEKWKATAEEWKRAFLEKR